MAISIGNASTIKKFLIQIFIDGTKFLVMDDKRVWVWISRKDINISFFWKFRIIRIPMQRKNKQKIFISVLLYKFNVLDPVLDGGIWMRSGWEIKVWVSSETFIEAFFAIFGLPQIWCMDQNEKLPNWILLRNRNCSMEILLGEIISLVAEKNEFEYRDESTFSKISWFFWQ